jgi:FkbM family methyltransferase
MNLYFSPAIAAKIAERCSGRPLWQVNLGEVLLDVSAKGATERVPAPGEIESGSELAEAVGTYLSALVLGNTSEALLDFGRKLIWYYAATQDVQSLVHLTNSVFKSLTLTPPDLGRQFVRQCVEVNYGLHVEANLVIHATRRTAADYYEFAGEMDRFLAELSDRTLPKLVCFVFLTQGYVDNFDLWIDVFNSSTCGDLGLVIVSIGDGVRPRVQAKLDEIGLSNAIVVQFDPSRNLTVCGNGEDLYFLWYVKIRLLQRFVSLGHDVIYSDLDSFWLKNFGDVWNQAVLAEVDIAFMPSDDMPRYAVEKWGSIPCCGFLACRASDRLERFLGMWERWVEVMFDDQIGLAQMLLDTGIDWEQHDGSPAWRSVVWNPSTSFNEHVQLCLLNPSIAKRAGSPDISAASGVVIWHPRWITSKEETANAVLSLVGGIERSPREAVPSERAVGTPRPQPARELENLALRKPATQSSICEWSRGRSREEDAAGANNGQISGEAGFHTDQQINPWWQVDLGADYVISRLVVYNRQVCADRLTRFRVMKSLDGESWYTIFRKTTDVVFGNEKIEPFEIILDKPHLARYIRVQVDGFNFLHFNECQAFGYLPDDKTRQLLLNEASADVATIVGGRNGTLADVGGFAIFADFDRYTSAIVEALTKGNYEWTERTLARELLREGDRVIELGTAVGAVAMTAAATVGAANVMTFEANPYVLEDAKKNFEFNGLRAITGRHGIVRNKKQFRPDGERVPFYISRNFWASRLFIKDSDTDIVEVVQVPVFCLEDEIRAHRATALICDIEGGEVPLLTEADLSGIRLIIMETHYWSAGVAQTDAMVRRLIGAGFNIDLARSAHQVVALYREIDR